MGAFEDGQSFLAGVLAKLPESLRGQAKTLFESAEAKEAVVLVGDGTLARSDYSKSMDKIKKDQELLENKTKETTALYERNKVWYDENKAALDDYDRLKKAGGGGGGGNNNDDDPPPAGKGLSKEEANALIEEALAGRERGYVDVVAFMQDTGSQHRRLFGEDLNMRELTSNPKLGRPIAGQPGRVFSLQDAYNEKYGEQVTTKTKEAEDKRINDEVDKRLAEKMKGLNTQPFPIRGNPSPSVLDVLDTKDGSAQHTLDTAVALYDTLQANRG